MLTDKEVGKDKGRGPSATFRRGLGLGLASCQGLGLGLTKRLETLDESIFTTTRHPLRVRARVRVGKLPRTRARVDEASRNAGRVHFYYNPTPP